MGDRGWRGVVAWKPKARITEQKAMGKHQVSSYTKGVSRSAAYHCYLIYPGHNGTTS